MRRAVVLVALAACALAACEIQPPPKKQPVPVEVPAPPQPQVVQPPAPVLDAGVVDAGEPQPIMASEACVKVASHVVQVFIDTAKDPAQAAVYEQERLKMTRATAEACEKQTWSIPAQKCYMASKDPAAIKACENKFPPSPPPTRPTPPAAGSGAGSASPTGRGPGTEAGAGPPPPAAPPARGSAATH